MSVRQDEKGARTSKLHKLAALREEEAKLDATLRDLQTNDPALIAAMEEDIAEAKQVRRWREKPIFVTSFFFFFFFFVVFRRPNDGPTPLWSSKRSCAMPEPTRRHLTCSSKREILIISTEKIFPFFPLPETAQTIPRKKTLEFQSSDFISQP
jgi:hypothetical protein